MATTNSFEFLNQAKIRYDGGPEIEWINWIEEQKEMATAQSNVLSKSLPEDILLIAEAQLIEGRKEQLEIVNQNNSKAVPQKRHVFSARSLKPNIVDKTIGEILSKPLEVLGLGLCGLFISTIMFHLLISPSRKAKKGYQAQNDLVFKSSIASIRKSLWAIMALPTTVMHHMYCKMA